MRQVAGGTAPAPARVTVDGVRRGAARRLRDGFTAAGFTGETPELDARLLVAAAIGVDPGQLLLLADAPVTAEAVERIDGMIARRLAGEPVARIVGEKEFWSLPFRLSPATLVPRPDTETVVSAVLALLGARRGEALRLLDLGTGSGAILLALLSELPAAIGIGVDLSPEAAATARSNAVRLGLQDRASFACGNWAEAIRGPYDVIVSNPPYISTGEIGGLPREVRDHDPRRALDGGASGLDAYRAIIRELPRLLAPKGIAALELGAGQAGPVAAVAASAGLGAVTHRDLAGIERVLTLARFP